MSEKKDQIESQTAQETEVAPAEEVSSELHDPRWSVVTFNQRVANGLTYDEALRKMAELKKENLSGLCILTDEAAGRIAGSEQQAVSSKQKRKRRRNPRSKQAGQKNE